MKLSEHIGKAAWSTADKLLYIPMLAATIVVTKVIGETNYGVYILATAILNVIYMLSDGLSLQAMVNFGMREDRRAQAMTVSALLHVSFITLCTVAVWFSRVGIASVLNAPELAGTLSLFPIVAAGFLLRQYFLKVSQLHIDTRAIFLIDAGWIGSTVVMILIGWWQGLLVDARDMMVVSAIASGMSSLIGIALYGRAVRLTRHIERRTAREMLSFGAAQFGSAGTVAAQTQTDLLVLGLFASSAVVGNYDVAKKFFRGFEALRDAGALFVYPAVARLATEHRREELVVLVEKMIGFTAIVVAPVVLFIWIGPTARLFGLIYPHSYQEVPTIFRVMSLAALAIPFNLNVSVLTGLGAVRSVFRVTFTAAALFFVFAFILVPPLGAIGAALTLVASYATLATFSTVAVSRRVPFSLTGAFGRWRDAAAFLSRAMNRVFGRSQA